MKHKSTLLVTVQHVLFWIVYVGLNFMVNLQFLPIDIVLKRMLFIFILNALLYGFTYQVLAPNYLVQKSYARFYAYAILLLLLSCVLRLFIEPMLIKPYITFGGKPYIFLSMVIISQSLVVFIPSMLFIAKETLLLDQKLSQARLEKKEADLNLLKAKISPHFLLNTLNNIYAISYSENNRTSNAILQLSQLLQYTIYDADKPKIPLLKEIETVNSLIGLYQLKQNDPLKVSLEFPGEQQLEHIEIPSMIIFTLLENAIKYSALTIEKNAEITGVLTVSNMTLDFHLKNSISGKKQNNLTEYKGFGLAGLKDLLEAEYPDAYKLLIHKSDTVYEVNLSIQL